MKNSIIKKWISYLLGILLIFLLWQLGYLYFNNDYIIPKISNTFISLGKLLKEISTYQILGLTILRLFISIITCLILGMTLAGISLVFKPFRSFIKPIFVFLKTIPVVVVIVLILVAIGREYAAFYIIGVVVLPIIYEATLSGMDSIDDNLIDEVKMISKITPKIVAKIHLPLSLPYIFTSLIQSFGLGLKVLVMAEFITQPKNSIGNEIVFYKDIPSMDYVYAWSIILIVFVLVIEAILSYLKTKKN